MIRRIPYSRLKALYSASPLWLKRCYSRIPVSIRMGKTFRSTRREIDETQDLDSVRLADLQEQRLTALLDHAQRHTHFYRQALGRLGYRPGRDPALEVLRHLPLISRADLRLRPLDFPALGNVGEAVFAANTGGSSGCPLGFLKNNAMYPIEQAYVTAMWSRVGYRAGDRKMTLRGAIFPKQGSHRWRYNPIYNELVLSSFHLDPPTIEESLKEIRRFRPKFLHGYPSAIVTFLRIAADNNLPLPENVTAILCGSEPLYDFQRDFITKLLGCRVFSWYGQSESVLLAGECEHSSEYHSFPLYGILELIDSHGDPILEPGVEGDIVGTSLNNRAMPFIRYRTGDRGVLAPRRRCPCGRSFPRLSRVIGREQHFIFTSDCRPVPVTALIFGQHFRAFERIQGLQLCQREPGELVVRILQGAGYSEKDEQELATNLSACVDHHLRIAFQYCQRFPVNAAGKTDFVVQHLSLRRWQEAGIARNAA